MPRACSWSALPEPGSLVEDSAHSYETTFASVESFTGLVPQGGYFVVEDGCVDIDEMRLADDWPRGFLQRLD